MFERYTEPARRAIYYARAEALNRGAAQITTSDIMLGLTREKHSANDPFILLEQRAEELRTLFGAGPSNFPLPTERDVPLSDDAKKALAYANLERQLDRSYSLQSDHMLRGLLRVENDVTKKITAAGFGLYEMRAFSRLAPRLRAPSRREDWWIRVRGGRVVLFVALLLLIAAILYLRSQDHA